MHVPQIRGAEHNKGRFVERPWSCHWNTARFPQHLYMLLHAVYFYLRLSHPLSLPPYRRLYKRYWEKLLYASLSNKPAELVIVLLPGMQSTGFRNCVACTHMYSTQGQMRHTIEPKLHMLHSQNTTRILQTEFITLTVLQYKQSSLVVSNET